LFTDDKFGGTRVTSQQNALGLSAAVIDDLRAQLSRVAGQTIAAIIEEVPGYAHALGGTLGAGIEQGVQVALAGFLRMASRASGSDPATPLQPALDAAYSLGRGEASRGRTTEALLAAYRVGARVSWHELAEVAVAADAPAQTMAQFAELVFAYIDELSAASIVGHADELASSDREHHRHRERLTRSLLNGASEDVISAAADHARWRLPHTLTAVLLPVARGRGLHYLTDPRTLQLTDELPDVPAGEDRLVLLIPDVHGNARPRVKRALSGRQAVVGPARAWTDVRSSYERAVRVGQLESAGGSEEALDSEEHLAELILSYDPDALSDLRAQVLAPLGQLRPGAAEKLSDTLRAWLLHQGRRDAMAAALALHPQTVRYRMGQLRELYGDRLNDPTTVLAVSIALGTWTGDAAAS
jgi:sugar diacid utilization regulator